MSVYTGITAPQHSDNEVTLYRKIAASLNTNSSWLFTQPPVNLTVPVVSGNNWEGQTLTATNGTWSNTPTSYAYQWTADGTNIGGATNSTYILATGEAEKVVRVIVTATNSAGSASATSSPTATVMGSPATIFGADLVAWYDPSDATSITQSSNLVSQINDKSGNGFNLTASGVNRPTYNATGILSNSPGLYFDGSANVMSSSTSFTFGTGPVSLFTLSELDESGSGNTPKLAGYAASGDAGDYSAHSCEFIKIKNASSAVQTVASVQLADSTTIPIIGTLQPLYTGVILRLGTVFDGTKNQVFVDNQGSSQVAYTSAFVSPGKLSIGARQDATVPWKGYIGETIIAKRAVSSSDRLKLHSWLVRSWTKILICEGDSVVHDGPGFATPPAQTDDGHNGFCYASIPNISPRAFLDNIAIGGSDMQSASNTGLIFRRSAYLDNRIPANKYGKEYIVFFYASNNLSGVSDPATDAATQAGYIAQYASDLKAAGADKVVAATILSRTGVVGYDARRDALNAIITAPGWAIAHNIDAIADFAADSIMGVDQAPSINPTYFADSVHPNTAGHARLQSIFSAAINSV